MRIITFTLLVLLLAGCSLAPIPAPNQTEAPAAQQAVAPVTAAPKEYTRPQAETVLKIGNFVSETKRRDAKGTAYLIRKSDGSLVLRMASDFRVDVGPDLAAYITDGAPPNSGINLGTLRSPTGAQEYLIPNDVHENDVRRAYVFNKDFDLIVARADLR